MVLLLLPQDKNSEARMVTSHNEKVAHLVVSKKTGDFVCDFNCLTGKDWVPVL